MLIGDSDQSIFEWNNADPALFDAKYEAWEKIELDENWRSSQRICNFKQSLSSFPRSFAVAPEVAGYDYVPTIMGYTKSDTASMVPVLGAFFATCAQHSIAVTKQKVAVLYRGKAMAQYLGMSFTANAYDQNPWLAHNYHVKDIILGKFLLERGYFKEGYHKLEKGFFEATYKPADRGYRCTSTLVASYISKVSQLTVIWSSLLLNYYLQPVH
jgi:DNA helicase II / ATP-dependent DNA helicase PcrA